MKQKNLIAYALNFTSFLLDTAEVSHKIERIILFGSVARGDFTENSDIDIFIDTKEDIEKEVEKTLNLFIMSQAQKLWEMKGLKHELSLKVGDLNHWQLKRSIISEGILLYGKVKQTPEDAEFYVLLQPSFKALSRKRKLALWRKLYGYKQKVGKKFYHSQGLLSASGGKRIESGLLVPARRENEVRNLLRKNKVHFTIRELWSDSF